MKYVIEIETKNEEFNAIINMPDGYLLMSKGATPYDAVSSLIASIQDDAFKFSQVESFYLTDKAIGIRDSSNQFISPEPPELPSPE